MPFDEENLSSSDKKKNSIHTSLFSSSEASLPVNLLHLLCFLRVATAVTSRFHSNIKEADWFNANFKCFTLELGKMDQRDFRIKISAIQLLWKVRTV